LLHNRLSIVRLLVEQAPPTPPCFNSDRDYHEYLLLSQRSGVPVVRREDRGKHSGNRTVRTVFSIQPFQHCLDCAIGSPFQKRMVREGRCEMAAKGVDMAKLRRERGGT
jgi:hypothetical protein